MRRVLFTVLLLTCLAPPAHATQGMNLRWDACMGDGGVRNKTFACDTNTGGEQLYVSFELDSLVTHVSGVELSLLASTPAGLPGSWWSMYSTGSCRRTALSASALPLTTGGACSDFWQGQASGGITSSSYGFPSLGMVRITAAFAIPTTFMADLYPGVEYFAMRVAISHSSTTGTGSCPGCLDPVCLGIENLVINRPVGYSYIRLAEETAPGSSTASWQGAAPSSIRVLRDNPNFPNWYYRVLSCASATPARNHTWGMIKSLYH